MISRFRLTNGSMGKRYPCGDFIDVRMLDPGEKIRRGKNYFVQRTDGKATFQRVAAVTDAHVLLRPLDESRAPVRIPRRQIARIGICVGVLRPIKYKSGQSGKPITFAPGSKEGFKAKALTAA